MSQPLVAVVLLAAEADPRICESLESVAAQSYRNLDIVIVDGSPERSAAECAEAFRAKDSRVRYIAHPGESVPGILYDTWQEALGKAGYAQWVLPGDVLEPNKIGCMMQVYINYPQKHVAMVASHLLDMDKNGQAEGNPRGFLECKSSQAYAGKDFLVPMLCGEENVIGDLSNALVDVSVLRECLQEADWCDGLPERILWMMLLFRGKLAYIPEPLTRVRRKNVTLPDLVKESLQWAALIETAMGRTGIFDEAFEARKAMAAWLEEAAHLSRMAMGKNIHTGHVGALHRAMATFSAMLARESEGRRCACCGQEMEYYLPLTSYYDEMYRKYGGQWGRREMENRHEMVCGHCGASDRYRAYALWMKRELDPGRENFHILEIAPEACMTEFVRKNFPRADYRTGDLNRDDVDYRMDVMDMRPIADGSIDFFLCSHVLEHVRDDRKAMRELYRVLAPGGRGICVVPIDLDQQEIDEDPDCTDVGEQWRRFGMDSHVRKYSRAGYLQRLEEAGFHVDVYGKEYFGEEALRENGLEETAAVYVVSRPT